MQLMKAKRHTKKKKSFGYLRDKQIMLLFLRMQTCEELLFSSFNLIKLCHTEWTFFFFLTLTKRSSPSYLQGCWKLFPIVILITSSKPVFCFVLFVVVITARPSNPSLCSFPKEDETGAETTMGSQHATFLIRDT